MVGQRALAGEQLVVLGLRRQLGEHLHLVGDLGGDRLVGVLQVDLAQPAGLASG